MGLPPLFRLGFEDCPLAIGATTVRSGSYRTQHCQPLKRRTKANSRGQRRPLPRVSYFARCHTHYKLGDGLGVGSGVGSGDGLTVGLGVSSGVGLTVGLGVSSGDGLTVGLGVSSGVGLTVGLGIISGVGLTIGSGEGVGVLQASRQPSYAFLHSGTFAPGTCLHSLCAFRHAFSHSLRCGFWPPLAGENANVAAITIEKIKIARKLIFLFKCILLLNRRDLPKRQSPICLETKSRGLFSAACYST